jgi:hypothetical protein
MFIYSCHALPGFDVGDSKFGAGDAHRKRRRGGVRWMVLWDMLSTDMRRERGVGKRLA